MISKLKQAGKKLLVSVLAVTMLGTAAAALGTAPGLVTSVSALSETITDEDFSFRVKDDGTAVIVGYSGNEADVEIPSSVSDSAASTRYTVTEVAEGTIKGNDYVEKIYVPSTVTDVRKGAFTNLNNLTFISFTSTATKIEGYAVGFDARYEYNANEHKMEYKYYKSSNVPDIYGVTSSCNASNYAGNFGFSYYTIAKNTSALSASVFKTGDSILVNMIGSGGKGDLTFYTKLYKMVKVSSLNISLPIEVTDNDPTYYPGNKAIYTINNTGKYRIRVFARDEDYYEVSKTLSLEVVEPLEPLAEISCGNNATITIGESFTITPDPVGGTAPYKYKYLLKKGEIAESDFDSIISVTDTSKTFTPSAAGNYKAAVFVEDSKGQHDFTVFNVKIESDLDFSYELSTDALVLGDELSIKITPQKGKAPYQYSLYSKRGDGDYKIIKNKSSSGDLTYKPTEVGNYTLQLIVFDNAQGTVIKLCPLKVYEPLENNSYLSDDTIEKGKSVTVFAVSAGGNDPIQYAAWYKKSTAKSWTTAQNYSSNNKIKITPKNTGKYTVSVKIKDSSGTIKKKTLTLNVVEPLQNTSKISATSIASGGSVKVTASAAGGTAPYQFAVWYKKSTASKWTTAQNYSTNTSVTIKPKYTGKYDVSVKVKDKNGTIVKKAFTVTVTASELKNTSTISASSVGLSTGAKVTASATGGTSPYKYGAWYKLTSEISWTTVQNYTTNTSIAIKPAKTGTYDVSIKVKDASGKIVKKAFTLEVKDDALKNTSKISAASVKYGNTFIVTASSTGGTGTVEYAVFYKQKSQTSYTCAQNYSTNQTVTIKPLAATVYDVRVKAKDAAGKIVNKDFTVTVTK